jgi:hypothetical protein
MTITVFPMLKINISSISHQQAVAEHWDLPNTDIFQSKDVAFVQRGISCIADTVPYSRRWRSFFLLNCETDTGVAICNIFLKQKACCLLWLYSVYFDRGFFKIFAINFIFILLGNSKKCWESDLQKLSCDFDRAGHSLLFTLFANRYSATSMYHFAIATPLLF